MDRRESVLNRTGSPTHLICLNFHFYTHAVHGLHALASFSLRPSAPFKHTGKKKENQTLCKCAREGEKRLRLPGRAYEKDGVEQIHTSWKGREGIHSVMKGRPAED